MNRFHLIPKTGIRNFYGNTPSPRPVGYFSSMLPLFPIALLNVMSKEKRQKRTHENAYMREKVDTPFGNTARKQGGSA